MAHDYLSILYRGRSRTLTVVEVTLNAIITSAIFSSTGGITDSMALQITAGVLSMLVSVITGLKSALGYDQRYEQHRSAATRFSKLWTRFEDLYILREIPYSHTLIRTAHHEQNRDNPVTKRTVEWEEWFKDFVDVMETAPIIDSATWARIKYGKTRKCVHLWNRVYQWVCCCVPERTRERDGVLPSCWTEYVDATTKLRYYHKKDERGKDVVTWTRPKSKDTPPDPPRLSNSNPLSIRKVNYQEDAEIQEYGKSKIGNDTPPSDTLPLPLVDERPRGAAEEEKVTRVPETSDDASRRTPVPSPQLKFTMTHCEEGSLEQVVPSLPSVQESAKGYPPRLPLLNTS
eukprot:TRINITY_DN61632_c0_g1_i1.p1 TRINITY_DN61632_c0_g1~~TRINITY_DN61632_c0_g1_i1.p1  ORF type:complete len:394 (+),score=33.69 TRINITY_DN61632_c0_g1_i1:150-1184(+)